MPKDLGKKQKIEITITVIGIIFLINLLIGNIKGIRRQEISTGGIEEEIDTFVSSQILTARTETESEVKNDWGRDPFSFTTSGMFDAGLEGLVLNGIVWDIHEPYAIINNDVVKPGDKVGGMTVIEITETNVVLEHEGKRHSLGLKTF